MMKLTDFFKNYSNYYIYFQKYFFQFVIDFCLLLYKEKKVVEIAYEKSYTQFCSNFKSIESKEKYFIEDIINRKEKIISFINNGEKNEKLKDNHRMKFYKFPTIKERRINYFNFASNFIEDDPQSTSYILNVRVSCGQIILNDIILKLKENKKLNIYGSKYQEKTLIAFEICKYFNMANKFKKGIFYGVK